MAITTRQITVSIYEFDGDPMAGAPVTIALKGLGNGVAGAVSPGEMEAVTDEDGQCVFRLWQNEGAYSDTYYQIRSIHPVTGQPIHRNETFLVFDSDANVKDLIGLNPQPVNPTAAFLNQVKADKAAAADAAVRAALSASEAAILLEQIRDLIEDNGGIPDGPDDPDEPPTGDAPEVNNQSITVVQNEGRAVYLGPASTNGVSINYASNSVRLVVTGNIGVYTSAATGTESVTVTATRAGVTGSGTLSMTTVSASYFTEYTLSGVQVV